MVIAEMEAKEFNQADSADKEILDVVAKFSLQLRLDQQMVLNVLQMVAIDERVPPIQRKKIDSFVEQYMVLKRHSDSLPFIMRVVESLSLRRFWSQDAMKGQVIKTQNSM